MSAFDPHGLYGITIKGDAVHLCNCVGPQHGAPLCPCQMRGVQIIDGRYVKVTDLGPAPTAAQRSAADGIRDHYVAASRAAQQVGKLKAMGER